MSHVHDDLSSRARSMSVPGTRYLVVVLTGPCWYVHTTTILLSVLWFCPLFLLSNECFAQATSTCIMKNLLFFFDCCDVLINLLTRTSTTIRQTPSVGQVGFRQFLPMPLKKRSKIQIGLKYFLQWYNIFNNGIKRISRYITFYLGIKRISR
jgi:hypothetical protein